MTSAVLRSLRALFMVVVCLLVSQAVASAQDDAFKRGLEARGKKEWPAAVTAMQEAIKADAREMATRTVRIGGVLRIGGETFPYLPYYFLGEALKNRGDCSGAVSAWETSEDQREVQKVEALRTALLAGYKECAAKGVLLRADYRQQMGLTDTAYNESNEMYGRVAGAKTSNAELWRPEFDGEIERARNELQAANSRLVKARATRVAADFAESRSGAGRAAGILRPLEARLGAALTTRTQIQQQTVEIQQRLSAAEASEREIDALKIALPPQLASSRDLGRAQMSQSRDRLGVAEKTQNVAAAAEAQQLAQTAADGLAKVLDQLRKLARVDFEQIFQQAFAAATQELSFFATSLVTLDRLATQKPDRVPPNLVDERAALLKEQSALQRRYENARKSENLDLIQDVTRQVTVSRGKLDALIALFGPATLHDRGVNAALEQGARLYMTSEYQQALAALASTADLDQAPLQGHVHLFRAASLYALYVHSGEKDQKLRTEALAEIQRCKETDPALQPKPNVFSPSFINFFKTAGASGAGPVSQP